jgi:DNA-binding XRE family transcriptional regulator
MAAEFDPGSGFGPRLREARTSGGLSVRELARRVGCSASLISQIERGVSVPSVGVLYSLATELGSSLDYLLLGSGSGPDGGADMAPPAPVPAVPPAAVTARSSTSPAACAGSGSPRSPRR